MSFQLSSKLKLLIVPHVQKIGGAGIYIANLADALSERCEICFGGKHGDAYKKKGVIYFDDAVTASVFPIYAGVSYQAMAYRLFNNIFYKKRRNISINSQSNALRCFDVIVLTSSIQVLLILLFKRVAPNAKVVLIVQENVRLNLMFLGSYFINLASKAELVISVTSNWSKLAEKKGLSTSIVRNTYKFEKREISISQKFDCLYVGGGSKLKGFKKVCKLIISVTQSRSLNVCMAGHYSDKDLRILAAIQKIVSMNGGNLTVVGFQSDLSRFYAECRFLILPITEPHFCRPAIEIAAYSKTFLIPNFDELEDFVFDKENCYSYESTSQSDLEKKFLDLLDHPLVCEKLGKKNKEIADSQFGSRLYERQVNSVLEKLSFDIFSQKI